MPKKYTHDFIHSFFRDEILVIRVLFVLIATWLHHENPVAPHAFDRDPGLQKGEVLPHLGDATEPGHGEPADGDVRLLRKL